MNDQNVFEANNVDNDNFPMMNQIKICVRWHLWKWRWDNHHFYVVFDGP